MAKVYPSEDGYTIRGIAPPSLARQSREVKLMFYGWVLEIGLKQKDRDLSMGLDKDGKPLRPIRLTTRKDRPSAMTPSGEGDPLAPPLSPGRKLSRVRSLLTGRAETNRAEFWWKFDWHIGDSFARILEHQRDLGRDVFGLSPAALKRVMAQSWERYRRWEAGKPVAMPVPIGVAQAQPIVMAGAPATRSAVFGIGRQAPPSGQWSGGMRAEDWIRHFRQTTPAAIPQRPAGPYNRMLGHVWGGQAPPGAAAGGAIVPKPPKPKPRPIQRVALKPAPKKPKVAIPTQPTQPQPATKPKIAAPTAPAYAFEIRGNLPSQDAGEFRATIERLPGTVLAALDRRGIRFVAAETFADYDPALVATTPRGWTAGSSWAEADGIYDAPNVVVCRTRRDPGTGHQVVSDRRHGVLRHEAGHAFEAVIGAVDHPDFIAAYEGDVAAMSVAAKPFFSYFLQPGYVGRQEAFAEIFAWTHGGGSQPYNVLVQFPRCEALICAWATKGSI